MDTDDEMEPPLKDAVDRLRDSQPATDLWPGIVRQLEPRGTVRTMLIRWPLALAAGLVIAAATSVTTAVLMRRASVATPPAAGELAQGGQRPADASTVSASFAPGDAALARAVNDLERAVRGSLNHLDAEARASVVKSLNALDQAIAQAAARQIAAPDDPGVARYLSSTLRKKLELLRTVNQLAQES
jgi:hypothetical protein